MDPPATPGPNPLRRTIRTRSRHAARLPLTSLATAALVVFAAAIRLAPARDTGVYPATSRVLERGGASRLRFVKIWEAVVPGWPATDPLDPGPVGDILLVRTRSGAVALDARTGARLPPPETAAGSAHAPALASGSQVPLPAPSRPAWVRRLGSAQRDGALVEGPDGVLAVLGRDGAIEVRDARRGHLRWRRVAGHRVSGRGLSVGEALLVAPDAASTLEAFRWTDGAPAGTFALEAEGARFEGGLAAEGDRVYATAVRSPLAESRVLCLRLLRP